MTFHVFRKEQTDVAIIEVGVGGQYDRTNIIRKPIVCGVTSLGLDHTTDLGNTILWKVYTNREMSVSFTESAIP
jgi:folylpolyglutamate synthase